MTEVEFRENLIAVLTEIRNALQEAHRVPLNYESLSRLVSEGTQSPSQAAGSNQPAVA